MGRVISREATGINFYIWEKGMCYPKEYILPPGKYPGDYVEKAVDDYFDKVPCKNKAVLRNNHKTFPEYEPYF